MDFVWVYALENQNFTRIMKSNIAKQHAGVIYLTYLNMIGSAPMSEKKIQSTGWWTLFRVIIYTTLSGVSLNSAVQSYP